MIEIINSQRKVKFDKKDFQEFAEIAGNEIAETGRKSFTIAFVSDRKMRELNFQYRDKDKTTDVLSFPFEADEFEAGENILGDIIISAEQAAKQADENNLSLEREIRQLIVHGILHLCGYDHETDDGEMNRRELDLREILKIN